MSGDHIATARALVALFDREDFSLREMQALEQCIVDAEQWREFQSRLARDQRPGDLPNPQFRGEA